MLWWQLCLVALIQGACELLPVSSSAHVIVAEKLMGYDPSSPEMTMLLVLLHTGTMFAVIVYFWGDSADETTSPNRENQTYSSFRSPSPPSATGLLGFRPPGSHVKKV